MRTYGLLRGIIIAAALVVTAASTASARQPAASIRFSNMVAGLPLDADINGDKFGSGIVSPTGTLEAVLNDANSQKKFRAPVFLDTCATSLQLHIAESVEPGPVDAGCNRRRLGVFEFRPDHVTVISGAQPIRSPFPVGSVGGGALVDSSDLVFRRNLEVLTGHIGGVAIPEERNTEVPSNFNTSFRVTGTAPRFAFPLGQRLRADGQLRFAHYVNVAAGTANGRLDYVDLDENSALTRWSGDGTQWSAGYGATIQVCQSCPWYVDGSYTHSRLRISDMNLATPIDLSGLIATTEGSFRSTTNTAAFTVARHSHFGVMYVGGQFKIVGATLSGRVLTAGGATTVGPSVQLSFENEFGTVDTSVIGGASFRIPGTRAFVRVDLGTNGTNHTFSTGIGLGWFPGKR